MSRLPQYQRVAAYAVVVRAERILLCRLAERVSRYELWTLPGGGLEHGENPRDAVIREVHEETGMTVAVADTARVYSAYQAGAWRGGVRVDAHSLRIVYEGWVPLDAPAPRVVEVDGSTSDAAWVPVADVLGGVVPVAPLVMEALADHRPSQRQRLAAYALIRRSGDMLLTRISPRGAHAGSWTLPGGGIDHGEPPAAALAREVAEECGVSCSVGQLLGVHDIHFAGTAPTGRYEDYHGVHLVYAAHVAPDAEPRVAEVAGTCDAAAWVTVADVDSGAVPVLEVVRFALDLRSNVTSDP